MRGEQQFNSALIGVVIVFTLLSLLVGWWAASRVMSPVSELAQRAEGSGRSAQPEPLATHFADDEVGQLAAALDDYAMRLTEVVQRDREFNADVSHELRTPLAVIKGAVELLLSRPERRRQDARAPAAHPARRAAMHRPDQRAAAAVAQRARPRRGGCRAHRRTTAGRAPRATGRQAAAAADGRRARAGGGCAGSRGRGRARQPDRQRGQVHRAGRSRGALLPDARAKWSIPGPASRRKMPRACSNAATAAPTPSIRRAAASACRSCAGCARCMAGTCGAARRRARRGGDADVRKRTRT